MPFSKNWTDIADSQVDADSPLDTTLITGLRDNGIYLNEWIGADYTPEPNHSHDGVNSRTVAGSQELLMDSERQSSSMSFTTVDTAYVYIPADTNTLTYYMRLKDMVANGQAEACLESGGITGTSLVQTNSTYTWTGSGTIDVSTLSGWQTINIQLRHTTDFDQAYIDKAVCRMT